MSTAAASPAAAATASSSKRPASANPSTPAAKRSRQSMDRDSTEEPKDHGEEDPDAENDEDMDDEAKAKAARREARTIRNRESAQRSRNQRKAHLAWLEQRVVELEAENRALRAGSAPSSPSKTRESSPAHSIVSLASDLGIPPEIVSAGGGVNLATVAPPPSDMSEDIKPVLPASPAPLVAEPRSVPPMTPSAAQPTELHEENIQLRYRVSLLEGIVKQTAAYFSNNTPIDMHMVPSPAPLAMNRPHRPPPPGMDATLSPPMFATHHREPVHSPLRLQTQLDNTVTTAQPNSASVDVSSFVDLSTPVARHPAAVATSSAVSSMRRRAEAQQRARGSLTDFNLDVPENRQRLATGLDLHIGPVVAAPSSSIQAGEQAQDGWFPEGAQAVQWDEEMNDLLETLEGQANSASPVVSGGNVAASTATGEQWTWEAAMVEF